MGKGNHLEETGEVVQPANQAFLLDLFEVEADMRGEIFDWLFGASDQRNQSLVP